MFELGDIVYNSKLNSDFMVVRVEGDEVVCTPAYSAVTKYQSVLKFSADDLVIKE